MYSKCDCPRCGKIFYNDTSFSSVETRTCSVIEKIEVSDTLTEEEMRTIVLRFAVKCLTEGIKLKDLNERVSHCLNISPQFVNELISEIFAEVKCQI